MKWSHGGTEELSKSLYIIKLACDGVQEKPSSQIPQPSSPPHCTHNFEFIFIRVGYNQINNIKSSKVILFENQCWWKMLEIENTNIYSNDAWDETVNNQTLKFSGQAVSLWKLFLSIFQPAFIYLTSVFLTI